MFSDYSESKLEIMNTKIHAKWTNTWDLHSTFKNKLWIKC